MKKLVVASTLFEGGCAVASLVISFYVMSAFDGLGVALEWWDSSVFVEPFLDRFVPMLE